MYVWIINMKNKLSTIIFYLNLFLLFTPAVFANESAKRIASIPENKHTINLSSYSAFFVDMTNDLSIDDVSAPAFQENFIENHAAHTPYFLQHEAVWGRVTVDVPKTKQELYIHLNQAGLERIDFYIPLPKGGFQKIATGHDIAMEDRPYPGRKLVVPLISIKQGSLFQGGTIYYRAQSPLTQFHLMMSLSNNYGLQSLVEFDTAFQFFYVGVILVMAIYNFFLFLTIRDKIYFLYVIYISTFGIAMYTANGLLQVLLVPDFFMAVTLSYLFAWATLFAANIFVQNFLLLKKNLPRYHKALNIFNICLPFIFLTYFIDPLLYNSIYYTVLPINLLVVLSAGITLYNKYSFAKDFTIAWSILITSVIIYALVNLGIYVPYVSVYIMQVGGASESVLLAFALARRIRYLQEEKRQFVQVKRDLAFAGKIQKYLFPQSPPASQHYNIAWRYLPSTALSGDFYDYKIEKGVLSLIMVDVAGHGYAAGLIASMVKVAFHETFSLANNVKRQQNEINRILCEHIHFIYATALNLRIIPEKKEFQMVRSGHVPLLHYKKRIDKMYTYAPIGAPLGVSKEYKCEQLSIPYEMGDRLLTFTDGLIEELNKDGEEFGIERLMELFVQNQEKNPEDFCNYLSLEVAKWTGKKAHRDDISFLIIELK